jgi:glycosyltransferase involved in cell wall biosynthesis
MSNEHQSSDKPQISIILPIHNQADHLREIIDSHVKALTELQSTYEIILVLNNCSDDSPSIPESLAEKHTTIVNLHSKLGAWGLAVKLGLKNSRGDMICYTNAARTDSDMLIQYLKHALENPGSVTKAIRFNRGSLTRRLGSFLYNLECRILFGLSMRDINGTPKVFSRDHAELLHLKRDDDLIDLEFVVKCKRNNYHIVEVPSYRNERHGGKSTTNFKSAWNMYSGAYKMWKQKKK